MLKPQMPNVPGAGAMNDPLDFVKNLWGSMSVPGMGPLSSMAPAMSVEDLDKKIADLKAVETWLNMNMSMLRGTIQTLEVQRGTLVTLRSMGAAMAAAVKQPEGGNAAQAPYAAFFGQPAPEAKAQAKPEARPEAKAPSPPQPEAPAQAEAPKDPLTTAAAAAMTNPAAWWNILQDQFKQAVTTAMSPDAVANAGAKAQEAMAHPGSEQKAAKPAEKPEPRRTTPRRTVKSKEGEGN